MIEPDMLKAIAAVVTAVAQLIATLRTILAEGPLWGKLHHKTVRAGSLKNKAKSGR
jgi:hypothetical protein